MGKSLIYYLYLVKHRKTGASDMGEQKYSNQLDVSVFRGPMVVNRENNLRQGRSQIPESR